MCNAISGLRADGENHCLTELRMGRFWVSRGCFRVKKACFGVMLFEQFALFMVQKTGQEWLA
jgi:hypothetical protein